MGFVGFVIVWSIHVAFELFTLQISLHAFQQDVRYFTVYVYYSTCPADVAMNAWKAPLRSRHATVVNLVLWYIIDVWAFFFMISNFDRLYFWFPSSDNARTRDDEIIPWVLTHGRVLVHCSIDAAVVL